MPPEWAPHRGTWLSWPHRESSWPGKFGPIPGVFAEIVRHLVPGEEVHINVLGPEMEADVRGLLRKQQVPQERVFCHHHPTDDAWCRDHGPIFVQRAVNGRSEEAIVDWGFNAWGGKYPPFDLDDVIPTRIAEEYGIPVYHPGIVMEGGSLDVNGRGTVLTTEACLLNPNRNPTLSRDQIERYLCDYLGVTKVLWLGDGIVGDDTDGHVDDLTRFVDPGTVVTVIEEDPSDENFKPLEENRRRLRTMTDQDGRPLRVVTLPMPPALYHDDQRVPASYANFYIANGLVLLPAYSPPHDAVAQSILQRLFPDRRVIPIDSRDLAWGLGSFHCVTQQWPSLVNSAS
ncbi:MAG TPA: agmatine deiminase family protein [Gemmatimonadales bacterium]|jgi:agmatine deiminase|nr:agmatine deiminase family protein [Gemmatimonadales bacterium]